MYSVHVRTKLVRMWNSLGDACVDNRAKNSVYPCIGECERPRRDEQIKQMNAVLQLFRWLPML